MSNFPTYSIKTVKDFLTVPADRVSACLAEFMVWIRTANEVSELFNAAADDLIPQSESTIEFSEFIWIDDNQNNITVRIHAISKSAEADSSTGKFLEPMWQPLFDLMHQEHGITPIETECFDIAHAVDDSRIKDGVPIVTLQKYLRALSQEELLIVGNDIAKRTGHELHPLTTDA